MTMFNSVFDAAPVAFRMGDAFTPRRRLAAVQEPDVELTPADEQGLLRSAVDVGLSGLAKAGNILDLPGSSVRDILSGENPFDQWLPWNWTSGQNRTEPEEMLQRWGVLSPQFRKQHPIWSFIAGTGAAIGTDPLTFTGLPFVGRLTTAGKALERAGVLGRLEARLPQGLGKAEALATKTLGDFVPDIGKIKELRRTASEAAKVARASKAPEDLLRATVARDAAREAIGELRSVRTAAESLGTSVDALRGQTLGYRNLIPEAFQPAVSRGIDQSLDWLSKTVPARAFGAAFQAAKGGQFGYWGQKVAQAASRLRPEATVEANVRTAGFADEMRSVVEGFKTHFGQGTQYDLADNEVFDLVQELTRFSHEASGRGLNMQTAMGSPLASQYTEALGAAQRGWAKRTNLARGAEADDLLDPIINPSGWKKVYGSEEWGRMERLGNKIRRSNKSIQQRILDMGGSIGDIDIHSARFIGEKAARQAKMEALRGGRVMPVKGANQMGRSEEIAKIYTPVVNEMLTDMDLRKTQDLLGKEIKLTAAEAKGKVHSKYGQFLDDEYKAAADLKKIDADADLTPAQKAAKIVERKAQAKDEHAADLAKWIQSHKAQPMFTNPNLLDELNYLSNELKVSKSIEAIHELFRRTAVDNEGQHVIEPVKTFVRGKFGKHLPDVTTVVDKTTGRHWREDEFAYVTLKDAFSDAGFKNERNEKALQYFAAKLGKEITAEEAGELLVPAALANEAAGVLEAATSTKFQSLIGDAIDAMNSVFKIGVTAHPANWVRNRYSGVVTNLMVSGDFRGGKDIASYVKWDRYAKANRSDPRLIRDVLIHNVVDPAFGSEDVEFGQRLGSATDVFSGFPPAGSAKMTGEFPVGSIVFSKDRANYGKVLDSDANRLLVTWINPETKATATKWLPKENFVTPAKAQSAWNIKQTYQQAKAARKGTVSEAVETLLGQEPGYVSELSGMQSVDDAAKRIQTLWQTVADTSAKANAHVEWQNRVAMYLYLINEKGYTKMAASAKVRRLQLDYRGGLSGFEKSVMRRAFPFYAFSRLMAGNIADTLIQRPGGVMAQMIKASARIGGRDAFTPEYVSEGLSFPLGQTPKGDQRYFSATGLPYEDLFSFFGGRRPSRTMGLEAASRMTPYLKGPAEWVTGRSFFQQGPSGGRAIEDLDPVLGRTASNAIQYIRYLAGDKEALKQRPLPEKYPAALEQLASNSPLSRYFTTARTLVDPRKAAWEKAINLTTGARVTTISPQAQLAMAQERMVVLGKERFGGRDMTIFYVPEKELERLRQTDPEAYEQALKFKELQRVINKRRRDLREQTK